MCPFHRETSAHGKDTNRVGLQIAVPAVQIHHNLTLFWSKEMTNKKCWVSSVRNLDSGLAGFVGRQLLKYLAILVNQAF